jgi:hypothetical protein
VSSCSALAARGGAGGATSCQLLGLASFQSRDHGERVQGDESGDDRQEDQGRGAGGPADGDAADDREQAEHDRERESHSGRPATTRSGRSASGCLRRKRNTTNERGSLPSRAIAYTNLERVTNPPLKVFTAVRAVIPSISSIPA